MKRVGAQKVGAEWLQLTSKRRRQNGQKRSKKTHAEKIGQRNQRKGVNEVFAMHAKLHLEKGRRKVLPHVSQVQNTTPTAGNRPTTLHTSRGGGEREKRGGEGEKRKGGGVEDGRKGGGKGRGGEEGRGATD